MFRVNAPHPGFALSFIFMADSIPSTEWNLALEEEFGRPSKVSPGRRTYNRRGGCRRPSAGARETRFAGPVSHPSTSTPCCSRHRTKPYSSTTPPPTPPSPPPLRRRRLPISSIRRIFYSPPTKRMRRSWRRELGGIERLRTSVDADAPRIPLRGRRKPLPMLLRLQGESSLPTPPSPTPPTPPTPPMPQSATASTTH